MDTAILIQSSNSRNDVCVSAIARWNTDWPHTAQVIFTTYVIFFPSFSSDPAEFTSTCRLVNRAAAGRSRLTAAVRGSLFFITIHM